MDFLLLLKALILGIVEGITEFLPISSTGHMIIVGDLLNFNSESGKVFEIVIQFAAILAVCWDYRQRLIQAVGGLARDPLQQRFVMLLIIAFLPAGVLGLLFHHAIKTYLFNPITVATALVIGGVVIIYLEKRRHTIRINSVDDMNWKQALPIGFAQSLAMIPGVSRAGATIMGGLVLGLSRKSATEFSFFLAIPTMTAATLYDVYKNWSSLHAGDLPVFVVGFIASFIAAMITVRALLRFVAHHTFIPFAWYRIVFGGFVLLTYYSGMVDWSAS